MIRFRPGQKLAYTSPGYTTTQQASSAAAWWGVTSLSVLLAYRAIGAASQPGSKINFAGASYSLTVPTGYTEPAWDAGIGWTGDGSKVYSTGFVPYAGLSYAITMSAIAARNLIVFGESTTNGSITLYPRWTDNKAYPKNGSLEPGTAFSGTSATMLITPSKLYIDGVDTALVLGGWTAPSVILPIHLFRTNTGLSSGAAWIGNIRAFWCAVGEPTPSEAARICTSMSALS